MSHTKGPWIYDIHEGSFYIFAGADMDMVADGDPDDIGIARMRDIGRGASTEEQNANAALIAASPDLLDACNVAIAHLANPQAFDEAALRMKLARAIAKAEAQ